MGQLDRGISDVRADVNALREDRSGIVDEVLAATEETAEARAREMQESVRLVAKAVLALSEQRSELEATGVKARSDIHVSHETVEDINEVERHEETIITSEFVDNQNEGDSGAASLFEKFRCSPRILFRGLYDQPSGKPCRMIHTCIHNYSARNKLNLHNCYLCSLFIQWVQW